jgi:hypothetical protein
VLDDSPFKKVETYIHEALGNHANGISQSGCMVFLGKMLVHESKAKKMVEDILMKTFKKQETESS